MNASRALLVFALLGALVALFLFVFSTGEDPSKPQEDEGVIVGLDGSSRRERGQGRRDARPGRNESSRTDTSDPVPRGDQVLLGTVRNAQTEPLSNARVEFRLRQSRDTIATTVSDERGAFTFDALPARSGWIAAEHEGTTHLLPAPHSNGAFEPVEFVFPDGSIEGTVLTAQRRPSEGVSVEAIPTRRSTGGRAPIVSMNVETDAQGRFRLSHVGEPDYQITFRWTDCEQAKQQTFERPVRVGERDLLFVRPQVWEWTLVGRVVDGATGRPIEGAIFQAVTGTQSETDAEGIFRKRLCFTEAEIAEGTELALPYAVTADDFRPVRGRALLTTGSGERDLGRIELYRSTSFTQIVRNPEDQPVANALVVLLGAGGYRRDSRTDASGSARFEDVRQGIELRGFVGARGFEPLTFHPMPPRSEPLTLVPFPPEGQVRGVVVASPRPTEIKVWNDAPPRGETLAETRVEEDGTFALAPGGPGGLGWFSFPAAVEGSESAGTWAIEHGLPSTEIITVETPASEVSLFVHGLKGRAEFLVEGATLAGRFQLAFPLTGQGERIDLRGLPRGSLRVRPENAPEIVHEAIPEELHF